MNSEDICGGSTDRWKRVDEILDLVLEVPPEEQRQALETECGGDENLRRTVQELLNAHQTSRKFMEESVPTRLGLSEGMLHLANSPPSELLGRRVGVYRLERQLGRGGMGEVWLASRVDGEFEHTVAIKLLNGRIDSSEARERLRRERQMLARLDHPNIARLLDGGTLEDGRPYFVMERVEGERIDAYCARRRLSVEERLRLVCRLADAVASAHRQGLVHRDLKPANVLVTPEGTVKLVDFGIAKRVQPERPSTSLTLTGQRPMTPGYASPEQVRGDEVTTATDIYSLGALCYELITGRRPFAVAGLPVYAMEQAVCEHQVSPPSDALTSSEPRQIEVPGMGPVSLAPPEPLPKLRRLLKNELDPVLTRALHKNAQDRHGSVEEFAREIEQVLGHGFEGKRRPSLLPQRLLKHAVPALALTFLALSLQGFFTTSSPHPSPLDAAPSWAARLPHMDGILAATEPSNGPLLLFVPFTTQEESLEPTTFLINRALWSSLASRRDLGLIGERSSWEVRNSALAGNARAMADAVDADFVLWGQTIGESSSLRLQTQLSWAVDGRTVWSHEYPLQEPDYSEILDQIETAAAHTLGLSAPPPGKSTHHLAGWKAAGKSWPSAAAIDYAEASRKGAARRDSWLGARQHLKRALEADPTMAPAWALLATLQDRKLDRTTNAEEKPPLEAEVQAAIEKSLELDPTFYRTHLLVSNIRFLRHFDLHGAGEAILKSLQEKPMYTSAIYFASWLASASGDLDAALTLAQRAVALDPLDPDAQMNLAHMLHAAGRHDDALKQLEVSRILAPRRSALECLRSLILISRSAPEAAREVADLENVPGFKALAIAVSEHALGNRQASDDALHWLIDNERDTFAFQIAQIHACRNELDSTLHWLRIAAEKQDPGLTYVRRAPCFSAAREDPRLRKLVGEILPIPEGSQTLRFGFGPEQLETSQQSPID